ncbi:MAG TPA: helix-turn-helix domain-containing protein [Solirubrobacteraceae bacterium]|nr:helix-turn-helix domain-containing protein [Solirubrobacteraceae bacterium]
MPEDRVPLFVRLPRDQAAALDRLVDSTGQRKQTLVSELLADQLTVGYAKVLESAGGAPSPAGEGEGEEVLTLQEAAALLRLPAGTVRASAAAGKLPGRAFGEEWRFARTALLAWLAGGPPARDPGEPAARSSEARGAKGDGE